MSCFLVECMQVDIGNNRVCQNFGGIVSSEELRELNSRLQQEHAGASAPSGSGVRAPPPQRRVDPNSGVAPQGSLEGAGRARRRSSCNLSRSSAGSRHSRNPPHRHGSTQRSRSIPSLSPEEAPLGAAVLRTAAAAQTGQGAWMNTPGNSSTTQNAADSPRANATGVARKPSNFITRAAPPSATPSTPAAFSASAGQGGVGAGAGGASLSSIPMATVASAQLRQRGWSDAANGSANGAAADGAHAHAAGNGSANRGAGNKNGDVNRRAEGGSGGSHDAGGGGGGSDGGNRNDKPAAAAGPKLAQTKIQVGMRLRRWIIINRIGAGSFGETFTAMEVDGPVAEEDSLTVAPENLALLENLPPLEERNEVCIKVEQENKNVLRLEALALKKVQPCPQVVRYLGSGCTNGMNYLVMEKLGPNLAELRRRSQHGTFNIYTTLKAGISCLTAIRGVHDLGLVHRDIKPSNFVTGLPGTPEHTTCYLIDFGLARRFRRSNGEIRPPRDNAGFRGTSRYASVASHHHQELGRVDDLWSLLFMLVEFATGTLPWRKYKEKDDIGRCKEESISPHLVRNLPREFQPFLAHLQTLRYEDEPDYDLLLTLMHRALERRGYPPNKPVEWEMDPSMIDSGMDADGMPVAEAGAAPAVHGSVLRLHDVGPAPEAVANGHAVAIDANGRRVQVPPRRAAPLQPDAGPQDGMHTPLHGGNAGRVGSGGGNVANGVLVNAYGSDAPLQQNSGTLRVSEVDIGGAAAAAAQDGVFGQTPLLADPSLPYHSQRLRPGTADGIGGTGGFPAEGSETPGAPASSEEYDPKEFSPRENDEVTPGRSAALTLSAPSPVAPTGNRTGTSTAVVPPPGSILEPNNSSQWRDGVDSRNGDPRRSSQAGHSNTGELEGGRRAQHQPPQPQQAQQGMGGPAADLDAAAGAETGEAQQGAAGKGSPKKKKKSNCDCAMM